MLNTNRGAGKQFGVDEKIVKEWRKPKSELLLLPAKPRRMIGGGCRAALPEMEQSLASWIESLWAHNARVTRSNVKSKALELAQEQGTVSYIQTIIKIIIISIS